MPWVSKIAWCHHRLKVYNGKSILKPRWLSKVWFRKWMHCRSRSMRPVASLYCLLCRKVRIVRAPHPDSKSLLAHMKSPVLRIPMDSGSLMTAMLSETHTLWQVRRIHFPRWAFGSTAPVLYCWVIQNNILWIDPTVVFVIKFTVYKRGALQRSIFPLAFTTTILGGTVYPVPYVKSMNVHHTSKSRELATSQLHMGCSLLLVMQYIRSKQKIWVPLLKVFVHFLNIFGQFLHLHKPCFFITEWHGNFFIVYIELLRAIWHFSVQLIG